MPKEKINEESFSFFKKAKIFRKEIYLEHDPFEARMIGPDKVIYFAKKDNKEIPLENLYIVQENGTTKTNVSHLNELISDEKLILSKSEAKEFAEMILILRGGSIYESGKILEVKQEKDFFKAIAKLKHIIGMVPYHYESDLEFSFNKDGTIKEFKQSEKWIVEGY